MNNHSTTFDLDKSKLSALLKIGLKGRATGPGKGVDKSDLWSEHLAKPLPLESSELQMLPGILTDYCQRLGLLSQETIGVLLKNPDTDLAIIQVIKKYAKQLARKSQVKDARMIASTLYYAAIAHALVHHHKRITSLSYQSLSRTFLRVSKFDWLARPYAQLFTKAQKQCRLKCS